MDTFDLQFNSEIINKIKNFYNSTAELLLLCGFSGSAKTELLNSTLKEIEEEVLIFKHHCFALCSVDDFLLNFYDSFRKFSLENRVHLKKSMGDTFAQKVSFYFKNSDKKALIIIDNYELVSEDLQILSLLAHLAKLENTKVVLVSQNKNIDFFKRNDIEVQTVEIGTNSKENFALKLKESGNELKQEILDEFFEISQGHELYLRMVIRYSKITGIGVEDLILEYKKRELKFNDFIISKVVSLVPAGYFSFLQNLCALNFPVSVNFIENYKLGDIVQIDYLKRNMLISKVDETIAIKGYFRNYFLNSLSVQEKFKIFKNICEIYEQELAKSPKDRLLRLSRESIRKQIEILEKNTPQINKLNKVEQANFSYISLAQEGSKPWFEGKGESMRELLQKKKDSLKKNFTTREKSTINPKDMEILKEYRAKKAAQEQLQEAQNKQIDFERTLEQAQNLENEYQYSKANEILAKLKPQAQDDKSKIEILKKLASNNEKLNNYENAIEYYTQISTIFFAQQNWDEYFETLLKSANLYKNLYRFTRAKSEYLKIANCNFELEPILKAQAYLGLGDICENENNLDEALEHYKKALEQDFSDPAIKAELFYKTALVLDDMQEIEEAIEYYNKNIEYSNTAQNKWLPQAYTNCALLYNYNNDKKSAISYLELAIKVDEKDENLQGIYFSCREIAKIFAQDELEGAVYYMQKAINLAQKMEDSFKTAFAYLELGDIFYDKNQNEQALESFFKAKIELGENISDENSRIIEQRINDMKVKMVKNEFIRISTKYVKP